MCGGFGLKCNCPVCKEGIDVPNDKEEGDFVRCEECGELLEIEVRKGKFKLVTDQEKKFEEMQELDEESESEDDEE